jgi:peptide/nickel transport system substrate-binding protein
MVRRVSRAFAFRALCVFALLGSAAAQEVPTFYGGYPYPVPPDGHFNTFATGAINFYGFYADLIEPPLGVYKWAEAEYEGLLVESFGFDDDNNYVVALKDGITWSDGTPLTSADVVTTFNLGYLLNWSVWSALEGVEAVDERTVRFVFAEPSFAAERQILIEAIRPDSVYGELGARAGELVGEGLAAGDEAFDSLLEELTNFRPETYVASGPYLLTRANVGDARALLTKNEGGFNADVVRFDEVVLWNGETETVTPLVTAGELWYGTYGFPPATEEAFVAQGIDIIRGPLYTGPALYFNHEVAPFDRPEVRRALAHAIDRDENGFVALGDSGVAVEYMTGMSDLIAENNVDEAVLDELDEYDYDPELAAQMLEDIGFSRGDDGIWRDDTGKRMAFTLIFPSDYADWAAAAENVTQALNEFGFDITARGVLSQQQQQDVYDGNFELAIRNWGVGSPLPYLSYLEPYQRYNGQGTLAGEGAGDGMSFDTNVTYSGGEVDVLELALASSRGLDEAQQREQATELARSFNELLPIIPLWERYGNNPMNREFLDAPPSDDPIYANSGADPFITYLILTGGIGPAAE